MDKKTHTIEWQPMTGKKRKCRQKRRFGHQLLHEENSLVKSSNKVGPKENAEEVYTLTQQWRH